MLASLLAPGVAWGQQQIQIVAESSQTATTATTVYAPYPGTVVDVTNGTQSGTNLFHRFSTFDTTQGGIQRVNFVFNAGVSNVIVGVTGGAAKISVPLVLSSSANLIFMSPNGLQVSGGAAFMYGGANGPLTVLPKVSLTTANRLYFQINNASVGYFEAVPPPQTSSYPNGSPDMPSGLSAGPATPGAIILDGQSNGALTLQVGQGLMVAALAPGATSADAANLSTVKVKGQVTLQTGAQGAVYGAFRVGEWLNNAWDPATLTIDSSSSTLGMTAPVEVTPGSQLVLNGGAGSIALAGLVKLLGWEVNGVNTFASLVNASGSNTVAGGIALGGPGRIAVNSGSLAINGNPQVGIEAVYPTQATYQTDHYGSLYNAYNLLFDIASGASSAVNGAISLGAGGVTKLGGGKLVFNSLANAYTGPTKVQGGFLQVNGRVPATATCSNGGASNLCLTDVVTTVSALQQDAALVSDAVAGADALGPDADQDSQVASFDLASGEGVIAAPDLAVDVAVNDSFTVADAQGTGEAGDGGPGGASADGANGGAGDTAAGDGAAGGEVAAAGDALAGAAVTTMPSDQASDGMSRSDGQAARDALQSLAPELGGGGIPATPTPQQLQAEMQRQVQQVRAGTGPLSQGPREDRRADEAAWIASTDLLAAGPLPPTFQRAAYQPAIVHLRFSDDRPTQAAGKPRSTDAFLDITLVPLDGAVEGRRVEVSKKVFSEQLRQLYTGLSRQDSLDVTNPKAPARQLFNTLIGPIAPLLQARGVTTLLIAADRGLQAVPFAALHDGSRYFGDRYAFAITPSLALTNLNASGDPRGQTLLAAGASRFDGLAPLPLVPQELDHVGSTGAKDLFLNKDFTPEVLLEKAGDPRYGRVHVATHAEFLPGGPAASYLYSGVGPIPLSTFTRLRQQRKGAPLDLISFSACRTALGDPSSELGFAGLAVQAGARSAAGTLWYVDDVATSAYFQQMYRYLGQGVPKAEALQLTRQAFLRGLVRLDGDRVIGPDGAPLLQDLTSVQQRRVRDGMQNPYFWGGIELVGAPW